MPYSIEEHIHRYATWTAARAQRAFATNEIMRAAINQTTLREFTKKSSCSRDEFDNFHGEWVGQLNEFFNHKNEYGRYAKIIAIYLKSAVVLPKNGEGELCSVIHPPVDRILLDNLLNPKEELLQERIEFSKDERTFLRSIRWTLMTEDVYWKLVEMLREKTGFTWELERFWNVELQ